MCLEGSVAGKFKDFFSAIVYSFCCFFVFNMEYPRAMAITYEFIQRWGKQYLSSGAIACGPHLRIPWGRDKYKNKADIKDLVGGRNATIYRTLDSCGSIGSDCVLWTHKNQQNCKLLKGYYTPKRRILSGTCWDFTRCFLAHKRVGISYISIRLSRKLQSRREVNK